MSTSLLVLCFSTVAFAEDVVEEQDEMVITATRTPGRLGDSPVAMEVIGRSELEGSGADTLAEVLERQPGLQVTRSFRGSALRMNGLDSDYVLILIDGQPVQGRIGGAIDLSRFPVERIERVEIVRGAASALYGADAIGGVVNIISRRGEPGLGVQARLGGGAMLGAETEGRLTRYPGGLPLTWRPGGQPNATIDSNVSASAGGEKWSSWSLASVQSTPAVARPGERTTQMDGQTTTMVSERVDWRPSDDHRWAAQTAYTQRQRASLEENAAGAVVDRAFVSEFIEASVSPDWLFGKKGRLTTNLAWSGFRDQAFVDQRGATALDGYEETWDHATELDVIGTVLPVEKHAITTGVELRHEVLRTDRLSLPQVDRQRASVFAQDVWALVDGEEAQQVLLVTGLRYDRDSLFGDAWSPRVALRWDPSSNMVVRGSVGRGFRAPPFKDLYLSFANLGSGYRVDGNPTLEPERAWSESLAWSWTPQPALSLDVVGQRTDLSNMIAVDTIALGSENAPTQYSYVNIDRAWTQSVDATAGWQVHDRLELEGRGGWLATQDVTRGRPLSGRPPATAGAGVRVWSPSDSVRLDTFYAWQAPSKIYVDTDGNGEEETFEAPAWHMVDARVAWSIGKITELHLGLDNLLDTGDLQYSFTRPRRLYAGVTVSAFKGGRNATM